MQKIQLFLFVTVFVILNTQGTARPMDSANGITLMLPTTLEPGHSITLNGVLDDKSNSITVLLPSTSEGDEERKIYYNYESQKMEVSPGVEGLNAAQYEIKDRSSTFTLGLTARLNKYDSPELNVTFNVNGIDLGEALYINAENMKSMKSIILKEGVKKVNILSFNFTENT